MRFSFIRPTSPDFNAHITFLRPAFDGSDNPKTEFDEVVSMVRHRDAALYRLAGKGVKLWFVGRVIDGEYHIVAMTGQGLTDAANFIIERVISQGYTAITYHTYRPGMRRILNRFGFSETERVREFDGKAETVHRLELGGLHGKK